MIKIIFEISNSNPRKKDKVLNLREFFNIGTEKIEKEFFGIISSIHNKDNNK